MSRSAVIRSERYDFYNSSLRKPAAAIIAIYAAATLASSGSQAPAADGLITHFARDMRSWMTLHSPFSALHLNLHSAAAVATLLLMLYQKEFIFRASSQPSASLPRYHRAVGYATCVAMCGLAAFGFCLRHAPALPFFDSFSFAFAAPWLLWAVLIPLTARLRLLHLHQLLSNMALKACLAVPCARAATALLQLTSSFSEAQAYYGGIALATAVFGSWQISSLLHFLKARRGKA